MLFHLHLQNSASVAASTEPRPAPAALPAPSSQPLLARAADQFIVARGSHTSVIAGYHWFGDWGRDTMISLPGLTLATGRYDVAKSILLAFAGFVDRGMLPNRFPDAGEPPEYATVDATLWFFEAARALAACTRDYPFLRASLYPVLADILAWHQRGTRYGICLDRDGLLHAGQPGMALTWMDARVGDSPVTPRHGKPVEIQALWYNALRVMEDLARRFHYPADGRRYREMADRALAAFPLLFWNENAACLYDVVDGDVRDSSIRPNQIFAVSLFHKMLPPHQAAAIVDAVQRYLLTPYGLRTLAPGDPAYRGRYQGDPASRDSAYHQGTVWPWLMGPFVDAYRHVHGRDPQSLGELQRYAAGDGLGQLPEVFDGDPPHRPGGCIAQAWSVAELLRIAPKLALLE
jgi:predicted glycogen debranching enzyme